MNTIVELTPDIEQRLEALAARGVGPHLYETLDEARRSLPPRG